MTVRVAIASSFSRILFVHALAACSLVNAPDDPAEPGTGTGGSGGSPPPPCETVADCPDDGDTCTVAKCENNVCGEDVTNPDDMDACTDDSCDASGARVNTPIDPDDMNDCTWDVCDPATGPSNPEGLPIFEEDFSGDTSDWLMTTSLPPPATSPWQIGPARDSGASMTSQVLSPPVIARDRIDDHSASDDGMLAGVVIGGFADPNQVVTAATLHYLESPEFDGTISEGKLVLRYWRYLMSDYLPFMANTVDVWDGTAWQPVFATPPPPGNETWFDTDWVEVSHDITMYQNAQMKVRFGFGVLGTGAYQDVPSWSLDDVQVLNFRVFEDDADPCTVDACDPATAMPTHDPAVLDDGNACTEDTCHPVQGVKHRDRSKRLEVDFASPAAATFVGVGPEWQIGTATMGAGDPGTDTTPSTGDGRIGGVLLGGNYGVTIHGPYYLSMPNFDATTPVGALQLEFQRWLTSDFMPYVTNVIEVSTVTGIAQVWQGGPSPGFNDVAWTPQTFDLTNFVGTNPNPRLQFGFSVAASAVAGGGWNLDDIIVRDMGCP